MVYTSVWKRAIAVDIQPIKYPEGKVICCICGVNETTNPDGICNDCKLSILFNKNIPPNF